MEKKITACDGPAGLAGWSPGTKHFWPSSLCRGAEKTSGAAGLRAAGAQGGTGGGGSPGKIPAGRKHKQGKEREKTKWGRA